MVEAKEGAYPPMQFSDIVQLVAMLGAGVLWLLYVADAFRDSFAQGMLTLLLPYYVVYYAYTRGRHAQAMRLALVVFSVMFLAVT